jgi:cytochrome c biogenesis protein CcdA/glutaredoxin
MVKKSFLITFFVIALSILISPIVKANTPSQPIYLFYGQGCPHCAQVENFFERNNLYIRYSVEKKEIYSNKDNALLFNSLLDRYQIPENGRGVPAVVIGSKILMGDKPIIDNFVIEADKYVINTGNQSSNTIPVGIKNQKVNLTLFAVIIGSLVDAINPCEFAVLIILMTTILATGNAKKALKSGLAFSMSIFISYFFMGLGLYKALSLGGIANYFFKIIGWIAIILGLFNLKDYFWYGQGFLMEVPLSWRPKLKRLINSITNPRGAFAIGFLVSLFLLPCTSGPYIVILGMLAKSTFDVQAILYLLLYNLIFVSPMVFISLAVYKGLDPAKAEEIRQKRLKTLHLITGLIMLTMGLIIIKGLI